MEAGSGPKLTLKFHLSHTGRNDEAHANVAFKELRETWENQQENGQTEDGVFLMVNGKKAVSSADLCSRGSVLSRVTNVPLQTTQDG